MAADGVWCPRASPATQGPDVWEAMFGMRDVTGTARCSHLRGGRGGGLSGTLLQDSEPSVTTVIILHVCVFDLVDSVSLGLVWNHFPSISQLKVIFLDNNGLFEAASPSPTLFGCLFTGVKAALLPLPASILPLGELAALNLNDK